MRLRWTPRARADLVQIREYISHDSPSTARLVVQRLVLAARRLREFPESGRTVPELSETELREVIHPPYRLVYRILKLRRFERARRGSVARS